MSRQFVSGLSVANAIRKQIAPFTCPGAVAVGHVVYSTGAASVDKAKADSSTTMPAIGVVLSKPSPTTCIIAPVALLSGFGGLAANAKVYVSTSAAGAVQQARPTSFGHVTQAVGLAVSTTQVLFSIDVQSSAPPRVDTYTTTLSQTNFTLTASPTDVESIRMIINGVTYTKEDGVFTVSGGGNQTVTWTGTALAAGYQVDIVYN